MLDGPNSVIITHNFLTVLFQVYFTDISVETVIFAGICCLNTFSHTKTQRGWGGGGI